MIRTSVSNLLDFHRHPHTQSDHKSWYVHLPTVDLCSRHLFDLNICFGASWEALAFWALKVPDPMDPVPHAGRLIGPTTLFCSFSSVLVLFEWIIIVYIMYIGY